MHGSSVQFVCCEHGLTLLAGPQEGHRTRENYYFDIRLKETAKWIVADDSK